MLCFLAFYLQRLKILFFLLIILLSYSAQSAGFEEGFNRGIHFVRKIQPFFQGIRHSAPSARFFHTNPGESFSYTHVLSFVKPKLYKKGWGLLALGTTSLVSLAVANQTVSADAHISTEDDPKELLATWYRKAGTQKLEAAVITIGNTKAGKSTTIASLLGASLRKISKGKIEIDPAEDLTKYPKIGTDGSSTTAYPALFEHKDSGLFLIDSPGLKDTRNEEGGEYDMVRNVTVECTIKSIDKLKLMVVVGYDELTAAGGNLFSTLISDLSPFFQPEVLPHILWVVTKSDETQAEVLTRINELKEGKSKILSRKRALARLMYSNNPGPKEQKFRKGVNQLECDIDALSSITKDNMLLFDPMRIPDRATLLSRLKGLPTTPTNVFQFDSDKHNQFKEFSQDIILDALSTIAYKKEKLQNQSDVLANDIRFKDAELAQVRVGKEQLVGTIQREITESSKRLQDLENKHTQTKAEKKRIHDNSEEVILHDESLNEKRRWGSLNWTVRHFKYKGGLIKRVEYHQDPYGSFMQESRVNSDNHGSFEAKYIGGFARDAYAHVKVYGVYNQQPYAGVLLSSLDEREEYLTASIKALQGKLVRLKQDLTNPGQLTAAQFETQKTELIKAKAAIDQELNSIREKIRGKLDLYRMINYARGKLKLRNNDVDLYFQSFLDDL